MSLLTRLFLDPAHITPDLAPRLRALADDCERLQSGHSISPALLQKAPLLKDWVPAMTPAGVRLAGVVTGHPVHGDRAAVTSPVWFADPKGTWVRTLSRFYRLGPPLDDDDIRRIVTGMATPNAVNAGAEDEA
jgi:hypothetical protein